MVLGVLLAALAQEDQPVPTFRTGVAAVLVDVVVVDGEGNAVADLTRDDFRVLEDGVPQTVATFDVTDFRSYVDQISPAAAPPEGEVNTYPRRFLFILNRQGAEFAHVHRAKRDLAEFIVDSLAEGDETMVIDIGYSLKVVQDFQAGKEKALKAVRSISQMRIDYPMGPDRSAHQVYRDLESIGEALAALPGRKIVLFFSNDLQTFAPPGSSDFDNGFSLKAAVESLNQANVTVYTFDIRGPESPFPSMEGGLSPLATETGGRFFYSNPSFAPPLRRVGAENARYYLLSYVSTNPALDGSYRKIEIEVARAGASVIARPGYYARERAVESADAEKPEAPEEARPSGELPLALEISTYLLPRVKGPVTVEVAVALPADLVAEGGRTLRLRVADGKSGTLHTSENPVSLDRFYVLESVALAPGRYLLEVVVSAGTKEIHRASTEILVPEGLADRFGLSSVVPVPSPDAARAEILPLAAVSRGEPLHLLFQAFPGREAPARRARASYRVLDEKGAEVLKSGVKNEIEISSEGTPVILSVPSRSLDYGTYRVEVRIEDASSGRAATGEIEFRVR
jgi:VWFA-related protein